MTKEKKEEYQNVWKWKNMRDLQKIFKEMGIVLKNKDLEDTLVNNRLDVLKMMIEIRTDD